eukprot:361696-Chlamydomonas_euryale.AAC.5
MWLLLPHACPTPLQEIHWGHTFYNIVRRAEPGQTQHCVDISRWVLPATRVVERVLPATRVVERVLPATRVVERVLPATRVVERGGECVG